MLNRWILVGAAALIGFAVGVTQRDQVTDYDRAEAARWVEDRLGAPPSDADAALDRIGEIIDEHRWRGQFLEEQALDAETPHR